MFLIGEIAIMVKSEKGKMKGEDGLALFNAYTNRLIQEYLDDPETVVEITDNEEGSEYPLVVRLPI